METAKTDKRARGPQSLADKIGFIGIGHMGSAMAANLAAGGYRINAYVQGPDRMKELVALGLNPTTELASLFDSDIVISMLPDDAAVHDVVFGRQDLGVAGLALVGACWPTLAS